MPKQLEYRLVQLSYYHQLLEMIQWLSFLLPIVQGYVNPNPFYILVSKQLLWMPVDHAPSSCFNLIECQVSSKGVPGLGV